MYVKTSSSSYFRLCLLSLLLSLSGCSSVPPASSEQCLDMAKYARSIAFLLDAGIPPHEIDNYTKVPVAVALPLYVLQAQVVASKFRTPAAAYTEVLKQCNTVGWSSMLAHLENKFPRLSLKYSPQLNNPQPQQP